MEAELEVLKILADLSMFLMSVAIATYTIAVSLLGPRYAKATQATTQAKERLEKELKERMSSGIMKLEELEKKIDKFRKREKRMKSRFGPLSLIRTVFLPTLFFGLSVLSTVLGIYTYPDFDLNGFYIFTILFIGLGLTFLSWSLVMIQRAARETAMLSSEKEE